MALIFLLLSIIFFFVGLTILVGGGWAFVILDLFSHSVPTDHKSLADIQKMLKPLKGVLGKLLGTAVVALSFYFFYLAATI